MKTNEILDHLYWCIITVSWLYDSFGASIYILQSTIYERVQFIETKSLARWPLNWMKYEEEIWLWFTILRIFFSSKLLALEKSIKSLTRTNIEIFAPQFYITLYNLILHVLKNRKNWINVDSHFLKIVNPQKYIFFNNSRSECWALNLNAVQTIHIDHLFLRRHRQRLQSFSQSASRSV